MATRPATGADSHALLQRAVPGYADEHRPLGSYALLTGGFNAALAAALAAGARRGRLPERIGLADVALLGVATHKLSRLVAKDRVTSFARAPFVRYQGPSGPSEVVEEPRGTGMRLAIGELVSCPYCVGQWIAGGLVAGLVHAPRTTRLLAGTWSALAIADFLQIAYKAGEERL